MKLCCFLLTEGTSLLLHELIELAFKPIEPRDDPVDIVVHVRLCDELVRVFFPGFAEQDAQAFDLIIRDLHPEQKQGASKRQQRVPNHHFHDQHFHALRDLLILLLGSLAVFSEVSFFFIPDILAQKESRLEPPSG